MRELATRACDLAFAILAARRWCLVDAAGAGLAPILEFGDVRGRDALDERQPLGLQDLQDFEFPLGGVPGFDRSRLIWIFVQTDRRPEAWGQPRAQISGPGFFGFRSWRGLRRSVPSDPGPGGVLTYGKPGNHHPAVLNGVIERPGLCLVARPLDKLLRGHCCHDRHDLPRHAPKAAPMQLNYHCETAFRSNLFRTCKSPACRRHTGLVRPV